MKNIGLLSIAQDPFLRFRLILPFIFLLLFILTSAILSPYFETNLMVREYQLVNSILGKICHQYPSRCFYLFGSNLGLCARCLAVYSTFFVFCIFFVFLDIKLFWKIKYITALLLCILLLADGITQYYGLRESNNLLRICTGATAGMGVSIIFIPAYLSMTSNMVKRIFQKRTIKGGLNYEG